MSIQDIILIGAGGHAHACIDVIEQQGKFRIAGIIGQPKEVGHRHLGYEVLASDEALPVLVGQYRNAIVTVGQIASPNIRIRLYQQLKQYGFNLPVIVSPRACVSRHASVGEGSIIMHDALVNAGATIGMNCIVNSKALVEHDAKVGDHCHVSTGSIVNGEVDIGSACFIGSGSAIKNGITIGHRCLLGIGVVVKESVGDYAKIV